MAPPTASVIADSEAETRIASETHAAIRELTRQRRQGSAQDARVLGGRDTLDRLLTEDDTRRNLRVRRVTDVSVVRENLLEIISGARREVLSLHAGTVPNREQLEANTPTERAAIERGVHMRIIYPTSFASIDYMHDYAIEQNEFGAMYRFADAVPYRMVIVDGLHAVVPLVAGDEDRGGVVTSEPALVRPLRHLAHSMLRRGVDAKSIDPTNPRVGPSELEVKVIRVMAMGLTDDVAAKRLAVSERTFRRYVATIMDRLGAVSRFQAGVRAVERGWL